MQAEFFAREEHLALLTKLGDSLPKLERAVDWGAVLADFQCGRNGRRARAGAHPLMRY